MLCHIKLLFSIAIVLSCFSSAGHSATPKHESLRGVQAQAGTENQTEEVLAPLTDAERQMDPRDVVLNQPDFVADLEFFVGEGFGGFSGAEHVAHKGSRYREESQFWVFVGESGKKSVQLYPQYKLYDDMVPPEEGLGGSGAVDPKTLALESDASFSALGTVQIDGHKCIKIEVVRKEKPEKIYLYAALDLKNLVIVAQEIGANRGMVQRLHNVSLDVPDSLVRVPSDFKPILHDKWTKVKSAKVTFKDRPCKDFAVFRAPGGELFLWVDDGDYPWAYLYRPKQGTVEIAFEGLLVSRSGTYIWQTKETEAFSLADYRDPAERPTYTRPIESVTPNSITFRSENLSIKYAIVQVSW